MPTNAGSSDVVLVAVPDDGADWESLWNQDIVPLHEIKPDMREKCWLRFGEIEQAWLHDLARTWVRERLASTKGRQMPEEIVRRSITLSNFLSERSDRGIDPAKLGLHDLLEFDRWLARRDSVAVHARVLTILAALFSWCSERGHLQRIGLSPTFIPSSTATPTIRHKNDRSIEDKRLPSATFSFLMGVDGLELVGVDAHDSGLLGSRVFGPLQSRSPNPLYARAVVMAVRMQANFGRRTGELLALTADRLVWVDGKPCIRYDNFKSAKTGVLLPIDSRAADELVAWIEELRRHFPGTPDARLRIFPANSKNPNGTKPIPIRSLENKVRVWLRTLETAIVAAKLAAETGMAVDAVLELRVDEVSGSLLNRGAGDSHRLTPGAVNGIADHIENRDMDSEWLFPDPVTFSRGERAALGPATSQALAVDLGPDWVDRCSRYESWGIPGERDGAVAIPSKDVRFIRLRHTYLQHCINAGVDIYTVSKLAGHTNVTTTMSNYVDAEMDDLREAEQKLSHYRLNLRGRPYGTQGHVALMPSRPQAGLSPCNGCTDPKVLDLGANACDRNLDCPGCDHFVADPSNMRAMAAKIQQIRLTIARLELEAEIDQTHEGRIRVEILQLDKERWQTHLDRLTVLMSDLPPAERNEVLVAADIVERARTANRINLGRST